MWSQVDHLAFVDNGVGLDNASLQKWMQLAAAPNPGTAGDKTKPDASSCKYFADGDLSQVGIICTIGIMSNSGVIYCSLTRSQLHSLV